MPIPNLNPDRTYTTDEIKQAYFDYGWSKLLEFDWIEVERDGPHLKRYRFNADALPCDNTNDVQYQMTFIQLRPTGVIKTCGICKKSDGPITTELGILLSNTRISPAEAFRVIQETGQQIPVGLEKSSGRRRVRVTL